VEEGGIVALSNLGHAGVVHQNIDPAQGLAGFGDEPLRRSRGRQIGHEGAVAIGPARELGEALEDAPGGRGDGQAHALGGQDPRRGEADAGRASRPRHQGAFIFDGGHLSPLRARIRPRSMAWRKPRRQLSPVAPSRPAATGPRTIS